MDLSIGGHGVAASRGNSVLYGLLSWASFMQQDALRALLLGAFPRVLLEDCCMRGADWGSGMTGARFCATIHLLNVICRVVADGRAILWFPHVLP